MKVYRGTDVLSSLALLFLSSTFSRLSFCLLLLPATLRLAALPNVAEPLVLLTLLPPLPPLPPTIAIVVLRYV